MNILVYIKNYFATRKDFKVMETNLKEFVAGDRKHLPSDGGLISKICYELKDSCLKEKYYKKARKILKPAIQDYFEQGKVKKQKIKEEYVNIDPYLDMTLEDLYETGVDFYIPIIRKIIYKGKQYDIGQDFTNLVVNSWHERLITLIVPDFETMDVNREETSFLHANCPPPPLPLEFIYEVNKCILNKYVEECERIAYFNETTSHC